MGDSKILTPPPGPKARELIERELKRMHQPSIDRVYPIFTKKIAGAVVEDGDGNRYLDFAMGPGSRSLGGAPDQLVNTIRERAAELGHGSYPYINQAVIDFAE